MKIENQLKELKRFLDYVEDFLDNQAEGAQSDEERRKMENYFPNLLRSSLFVTIYSAVENELNSLCHQLSKQDGLEVEDLRGNGIQRACTFLTRVCRVDFPEDRREWQMLRSYNQLRNVIVHNNGKLEGGNQLNDAVQDSSSLSVGKDKVICLDRHFCPEVLETAGEFFRQLSSAVDKKSRH